MFFQGHRKWRLMVAILSLSLLTVMAGAAVAPALGVIQQYFCYEPKILMQLIISMPALCIAMINLFFGKLCRLFGARTLTLFGLGLYIVFGCAVGLFAMINWRLSFLVYLLGFLSIIPVMLWMPNEKLVESENSVEKQGLLRQYFPYIGGMFLLMVLFFNYPANFALEETQSGELSISLYLAQFVAPAIITGLESVLSVALSNVTSYHAGILLSLLFLIWTAALIHSDETSTQKQKALPREV